MTSPHIQALLGQMHHPSLKEITPGLERVGAFLELLGNPQLTLPKVVHVAGTNGKGSTLAYLQAMLMGAGLRVHRYTSPHLLRFNERISLYGQPISDGELEEVLKQVQGLIGRQPVTAFEATTAAAFLAMARHPADVVLLEVGMGGRLDATNMVPNPALTIITPVAYDHCEFLGDELYQIAHEKAGILKPGVACVVARQQPEALGEIAREALNVGAPLLVQDDMWKIDRDTLVFEGKRIRLAPALVGEHQLQNAAMAAVAAMKGFSLTQQQVEQGMGQAVWPGRLQRLSGRLAAMVPEGAQLWLDGGHNPQGGQVLAAWLKGQGLPVHLVCGMLNTKNSVDYFKALKPFVQEVVGITIPAEAQARSAAEVAQAARQAGIAASEADSLENALQSLASRAKTPVIICICGSLSLVGRVLAANE